MMNDAYAMDASSLWQEKGSLLVTPSGCEGGVSLSPFHWWEHGEMKRASEWLP